MIAMQKQAKMVAANILLETSKMNNDLGIFNNMQIKACQSKLNFLHLVDRQTNFRRLLNLDPFPSSPTKHPIVLSTKSAGCKSIIRILIVARNL